MSAIKVASKAELERLVDNLVYNVESASSTSNRKRVQAFKGKKFLEALQKYKKGKYSDDEAAMKMATTLLHKRYFLKATKNPDRADGHNRLLISKADQPAVFEPKLRYVWMHEGSKSWRNFYLGAIILGFFACCLFPIWPRSMKVGVWYIAVTLLLFMIAFSTIRAIIFGVCWIGGKDVWILPNVFDEDASVYDSFHPYIEIQPAGGNKLGRLGVVIFLIVAGIWVYQQPTEFDGYLEAQGHFLEDLYSGALLTDKSQEDINNIDRVIPVEELMRMEEEAEAALAAEEAATAKASRSEEDFLDDLLNDAMMEDGESDYDEEEDGEDGEEEE